LQELVKHFYDLLKTDADIVLSGIIDWQLEPVCQTYEKYFENLTSVTQENWVRIHGERTTAC